MIGSKCKKVEVENSSLEWYRTRIALFEILGPSKKAAVLSK